MNIQINKSKIYVIVINLKLPCASINYPFNLSELEDIYFDQSLNIFHLTLVNQDIIPRFDHIRNYFNKNYGHIKLINAELEN